MGRTLMTIFADVRIVRYTMVSLLGESFMAMGRFRTKQGDLTVECISMATWMVLARELLPTAQQKPICWYLEG